MIFLLYGENTAESRSRFVALREEYVKKEYEIIELTHESLPELDKWLFDTQLLFAQKRVFFGQNLVGKKEHREVLNKYDDKSVDAHFVLWEEDIDDRTAKFAFTNAQVTPFKFPQNIFKFLDALYPGNKKEALQILSSLNSLIDENIIFYMIIKRARELVLISEGKDVAKLAGWQTARLTSQAAKWISTNPLIRFYDALYRIEVMNKTSATPYSVKKALDILVIYSL